MNKLIIFTDYNSLLVPTLLLKATIQAVFDQGDIELSGICIRNYQKYNRLLFRYSKIQIARKLKSSFDVNRKELFLYPLPINIDKVARQHGFQILLPPNQNINNNQFIESLKNSIKPDIAISYYCLQKFSLDLLNIFKITANYHNSLLPKYKGLAATSWSIYHGEKTTGFTFHRMNDNFDEGNILLQDSVPISSDVTTFDLEFQQTSKAVSHIPHLLEMLINRETGSIPTGESRYFSKRDREQFIRINDPSKYTSNDLMRRLKAFGLLRMNICGTWYLVTKLLSITKPQIARRKLFFQTSDGIIMQPTRFYFVPFIMYQLLKWIKYSFPLGR